MKNIFAYTVFGICAIILAIFILLKVVSALISVLWCIAVIALVASGIYLFIKAAKKSDEESKF